MQGCKVSSMIMIRSGPSRIETKLVSQGDELNQDSNYLWLASQSLLHLANPSLILTIDSLTTPEWST